MRRWTSACRTSSARWFACGADVLRESLRCRGRHRWRTARCAVTARSVRTARRDPLPGWPLVARCGWTRHPATCAHRGSLVIVRDDDVTIPGEPMMAPTDCAAASTTCSAGRRHGLIPARRGATPPERGVGIGVLIDRDAGEARTVWTQAQVEQCTGVTVRTKSRRAPRATPSRAHRGATALHTADVDPAADFSCDFEDLASMRKGNCPFSAATPNR